MDAVFGAFLLYVAPQTALYAADSASRRAVRQ
jgi:hypothetical protein